MTLSLATCPSIDDDFVAWGEHQASLLRERAFDQLDLQHLLEEWEWYVRKDLRALKSRLRVLIMHLLKCEFQPQLRTHGWLLTLLNLRMKIADLLEDSPSLAREVGAHAEHEYAKAVLHAMKETGLPRSAFPPELPYSQEQLLNPDFEP